ncbi:MAG: sigma-70 family RNA polymerase sigma factor [Thermoanaerobaculia bacterium]|nr:sigma-70 family RNA polymerase sigma factor [Thermoanaerobaculia bacterium]
MRNHHVARTSTLGVEAKSKAIRELHERFSSPIYNFFANRHFDPEECRDLVQETFFRAFRTAEHFRGDAEAFTWLWAIAKHVWLEADRSRHRLKRAAEEVSLEALQEELGFDATDDHGNNQLDEYLDEERTRLLREALQELPTQMRSCMQLRIFQELGYREIADVMRTSIGTVKSQLSDARERLRSRLSSHFAIEV